MLFQIHQGLHTLPMAFHSRDKNLTTRIDTTGTPQADTINNEAYNPEDEEDERAHHDDSGKELEFGNEPEHREDEEDG